MNIYFASANFENFDILAEKNGSVLLSYMNDRSEINKWVKYLREHPECKTNLFIDSGAFTAYTKGITIDIDEYIDYMNSISDVVTIFCELDVIPGKFGEEHTYEEVEYAADQSWKNYLYMLERVTHREKLLPVFHRGENFSHLKKILSYTFDDGGKIPYIALAPIVGSNTKEKYLFLEKCYSIISKSDNCDVKTHILGVGIPSILSHFPCTSSDATSYKKVGAFGGILINGKTIIVSDVSNLADDHIDYMTDVKRKKIIHEIEKLGFHLDDLRTSRTQRIQFNTVSLMESFKNLKTSVSYELEYSLFE